MCLSILERRDLQYDKVISIMCINMKPEEMPLTGLLWAIIVILDFGTKNVSYHLVIFRILLLCYDLVWNQCMQRTIEDGVLYNFHQLLRRVCDKLNYLSTWWNGNLQQYCIIECQIKMGQGFSAVTYFIEPPVVSKPQMLAQMAILWALFMAMQSCCLDAICKWHDHHIYFTDLSLVAKSRGGYVNGVKNIF